MPFRDTSVPDPRIFCKECDCEYTLIEVDPGEWSVERCPCQDSAIREEGLEEGYVDGHTAGLEEGFGDGYASGEESGSESGYDSGYNEGQESSCTESYQEGYDHGKEDGLRESGSIINLIKRNL